MSIDERDIARLEKLSFDSYNESDVFTIAIENYHRRTGHYPEVYYSIRFIEIEIKEHFAKRKTSEFLRFHWVVLRKTRLSKNAKPHIKTTRIVLKSKGG